MGGTIHGSTSGIDPNEVRLWTFTFGFDHLHPVTGESLGNKFVQIEGTLDGARDIMVHHFGTKWAFQYPGHCEAGVHKYSLREIQLPKVEE